MKTEYVSSLKQEIERTFGRKILSSADCRYLCDDIYHNLKLKISFNTLRRFFSLMETENQPSFYTLDILSSYCGFPSFGDFVNAKKQDTMEDTEGKESALLNYLVLLFRNTEVNNLVDITYFNLVQQTISFLEHHPHILDKFQREIAKTKNGQEFYFEQFVNIDQLNHFYGDGLRYYLNEKTSAAGSIFGHSMLCERDFLVMNDEGVKRQYKEVMNAFGDKPLRPDIYSRFFATQLYHAQVFGLEMEHILIKARQVYAGISQSRSFCSHIGFEFIMATALIFTQQYEEASFYTDEYMKSRRRSIQSFTDVQFSETFRLFQAIVLANSGKPARAKELLRDIDPGKFYFLAKQCLNILYLNVKQQLHKKEAEEKQIQYLIQDTGFKRLAYPLALSTA